MEVIPSINAPDFEGVKKRIRQIKDLGIDWGHIDVADGKFTTSRLWNNPKELKAKSLKLKAKLEAHLMIINPDAVLRDWLETGVKRLIIHAESAKDIIGMKKQCEAAGAELALAINPDTPIDVLLRYQSLIKQILILAVTPGPAGQQFRPDQLGKIKALRLKMPNVKIEVDGGINSETAKLCREAGADILVTASYLFNSSNPQKAYQRLKNI